MISSDLEICFAITSSAKIISDWCVTQLFFGAAAQISRVHFSRDVKSEGKKYGLFTDESSTRVLKFSSLGGRSVQILCAREKKKVVVSRGARENTVYTNVYVCNT